MENEENQVDKNSQAIADINRKLYDLASDLRSTRDTARDALSIVIGVDGNNGLKSSMKTLTETVDRIKEDFLFLRETAHNYKELKGLILRFLFTGAFAFLFQLGGVIWFFSADHKSNENISVQIKEMAQDIKQNQRENMQRDVVDAKTAEQLKELLEKINEK
jgi:septal ring factor EnvC (AmiA/AmiB activator)